MQRVIAMFLAAGAVGLAACGSPATSGPPAATAGSGRPAGAADRFQSAVRHHDLGALLATLGPDVRLDSPVLTEPFTGRATVSRLFGVLADVLTGIRLEPGFRRPGAAVVHFTAVAGGTPIEIVDLVTIDRSDHVAAIRVTARPLSGITALQAAVAPHLREILDPSSPFPRPDRSTP